MRKEVVIAAASVVILAQTAGGQTSTSTTSNNSSAPNGPPTICMNDPERHRFDFWIGEWDVTTPDGKPAGSSVIESVSGGCALLENWTSRSGGRGKSLNGYNPSIKQWQQFWIGQDGQVSEYRSSQFDGTSLAFFIKNDAKPLVQHRLTFTPIDARTVRQHSENTEDGGQTWKTEYDLYYHRKQK